MGAEYRLPKGCKVLSERICGGWPLATFWSGKLANGRREVYTQLSRGVSRAPAAGR
jgi:hypothetical protein